MRQRLAVIGGVNMDIHLFGSEQAGDGHIIADHYLAEPGGKGANQARAAARLGADVMLIAAVGADEFGQDCLAAITGDGVNVDNVVTIPDDHSGFVVIDLVGGHHVTRVFVPGANRRLTWDHVVAALSDLAICDAVVTQAEVPRAVLDPLTAWCEETGTRLFVDPAPPAAVAVGDIVTAEAITPNLEEVAGLTGRVVAGEIEVHLAARDLLDLGAHTVCIKRGAAGALVANRDFLIEVPTIPVEVVDETGGGDVFMAGLVTSRIAGADWSDSVAFANCAAAVSVSQAGLYLPTRDEVEAALTQLRPGVEGVDTNPA